MSDLSPHDAYDYAELPRVGWLTRLFWYAAGADAQLLARCPNSDRVKFQGLGGVVSATAALAFVSGAYAFSVVFGPKGQTALAPAGFDTQTIAVSVGFGLMWAAIIFNIDRFIVASTGKGDGTDRITFGELVNALPRIFMALVIGTCISAPLEIRVLKTEIDTELSKRQMRMEDDLNKETDKAFEKEKAELTAKIDGAQKGLSGAAAKSEAATKAYRGDLETRRLEIKAQRQKLEEEAEGRSASGKPGRGPAYFDKVENLNFLQTQLDADIKKWDADRAADTAKQASADGLVKQDVDRWQKLMDEKTGEIKRKKELNHKTAQNLDGLMMRIQISHELSFWVPLLIMLLLLSIEVGPIFFKMMLITGAYDYLSENQKRLAVARFGVEMGYERIEAGATLHIEERYHAAETVLAAERERLETEAELTRAVHVAYRASTAADIAIHPESYLEPEA